MLQEREDGGTEKVFSHSRDSPLEVAIPHDPDLSRQVYILRDLRANVTYEVTLKGVNKYGDGDNASFTFYTSLGGYFMLSVSFVRPSGW